MPPSDEVAEEEGILMWVIMVEQVAAARGPFRPKSKVGTFEEILKNPLDFGGGFD